MIIPRTAMILAAGRGERLRPLTDHTPKPLVEVAGEPVIGHTLGLLRALGIRRVVINAWHLAERLMAAVGDGRRWGVEVVWSREERLLNTGGGVVKALPLLGDDPFLAVNGDVMWDLDLAPLFATFDPDTMDGLLGLVPNPPYAKGDFRLLGAGCLDRCGEAGSYTYSGIQMVRPAALARYPEEPFSLNRFYDDAMVQGRLRGMVLAGAWADMGTPERLETVRRAWRRRVAIEAATG